MRHPKPDVLANHLEEVAKTLRAHGSFATEMGKMLATRGYPTSTLSDGGSRGSDNTSSTERAAIHPDRWAGIDQRYTKLLRFLWSAGLEASTLTTDLVAHAQAEGIRPLPAGAGHCLICDDYCSGADHDRLRAGYCPPCYQAWSREGRPERRQYERARQAWIQEQQQPDLRGA